MFRDLPIDELSNAVTHGIGLLLSIIGIPFIIYFAIESGSSTTLLGTTAFSIGLVSVFFSSTAYHLMTKEKFKKLWRKLDHMSIYLLIAGTYSAYILIYLNNSIGINFLIVHWLIVLGGLIFKLFYTGKFEIFSTILYLVLGWMVIVIIKPLIAEIPETILWFLVGGGIAYSVGVIFYVWEKYKFNHTIWHLFVLSGSGLHYFGILYSF